MGPRCNFHEFGCLLGSVGLTQFLLDNLFNPRSVAIVGATPREGGDDGGPLGNLKALGFDGPVYAVNPKYDEVLGYPCYPSIRDLPEAVDAVFLAVGCRLVPDMLEQAGRRGIRAAVAFASGFAEGGARGRALQRRITTICREYGIAFCGPNNIGLLNLLDRKALWVSTVKKFDRPGPIAVISQSGSVAMALSDEASRTGIAYVVTSGNEAVLTAADYLDYMTGDPRVKVVAMFLEAVRDPEASPGPRKRLAMPASTSSSSRSGAAKADSVRSRPTPRRWSPIRPNRRASSPCRPLKPTGGPPRPAAL